MHQLTGWAIDHRVSLDELELTRPSLEDMYLLLTGSSSGDRSAQPAPDEEPKGTGE
jgi:hypothetical protein